MGKIIQEVLISIEPCETEIVLNFQNVLKIFIMLHDAEGKRQAEDLLLHQAHPIKLS